MEILNNPWITGIGGGIISGFIVYMATNRLLSKKQDKEYSQKVTTANNELLYTMRPLIVQKQIPSRCIMDSVIESITRKYEVNKKDLFGISILADDLIREVMENAFLGSEQKIEFCKKINELKVEGFAKQEFKQTLEKVVYQKDSLSSQYVSILLATTASTTVLVATFLTKTMKDGIPSAVKNFSEISSITLMGVIVPMIAILITILLKKIKRIEREYNNKSEEFGKKIKETD